MTNIPDFNPQKAQFAFKDTYFQLLFNFLDAKYGSPEAY
jgi:hypothetical protein